MVGLGQAKAADPFAGGQLGQVFLFLRFVAVGVDRVHDQRRLHADGAAVAAVDPLDFTRHQTVADVVQAGAAVAFNRRAQKAHRARFVHDLAVKLFMARGHQHAGLQPFLAERMRRLLHRALVLGQLIVQKKRVFPVEFGFHGACP